MLDLDAASRDALRKAYARFAKEVPELKIMLATYFGALGDNLETALGLPVAGLHVDLVRAAEQSAPEEAWKAIVKTYLRPEMCESPEHGCPLATLAPELARADRRMKPQIVAELVNYKGHIVPFMPGRRTIDKERAFFAIFSTMIGAIELARLLPDPVREKVLGSARDFLLRSF